ncbi:hypothetical protein BDZ45DRAFT_626676 [Acephala macrosclerotiorum]|nr:hypothetical protein BDZ45DRAFT_626676 [Acephala macrosclerotiorum]
MDVPSNHSKNVLGQDASASSGLPRDLISSFRTGTTKSRNGCRVCKIRRIKCDETKPFCTRCTSTGRKCEGYDKPRERSKSKLPPKSPPKDTLRPRTGSPSVYQPLVDVKGITEQRRGLHYFRSRNMSDIPGNFEPYFWNYVVLQLSHMYPTILQSLTALSAIYEERENSPAQMNNGNALQQYNKAVNDLLQYLASDQQDPRVALTSCLIFVWIEFLQNNLDSGLQHLNSGLKVLRDLRLSYSHDIANQDRDSDKILGSLDRSFTRLRIQAAVHGSQGSDFTTSSTRELEILEPVPLSFTDVFQSRNILDKELNAIFGYMRTLREMNYYSSVDIQEFTTIQAGHLDRLQQWQAATKTLVFDLEAKQDRSQTSAILYLQLYYTLVNIILKTMFAGSEMAFDAYTTEFETMLTICASLLSDPRSTAPAVLSFDMGIIPPIFHLCLKCRVLCLRRRAIALLKQAPEREGMWHRDSIIKYCEWKISVEESWRGDVSTNEPLPEFARMYAEHVPDGSDRDTVGGKLMIRFKRGPVGLDIEDLIEIPGGSEMMRRMGNMV